MPGSLVLQRYLATNSLLFLLVVLDVDFVAPLAVISNFDLRR